MDLQSNFYEIISDSYNPDNYKADSGKTIFVPHMNFLPKNNLYKADTGTKTIFM